MFSVENFYYVLYTNLLEPLNINGKYFYPFGSTNPDNLSNVNLQADRIMHNCLFYDQEPIFNKIVDKLLITGNKEQAYIPFPTKNIYSKNDFEVLELLGKGAYAKVVKAKCLRENMIKAIKIIDRHFMERV